MGRSYKQETPSGVKKHQRGYQPRFTIHYGCDYSGSAAASGNCLAISSNR